MNAQELFRHWNHIRDRLLAALGKLTDEQLDFVPREGLWSLRDTVLHIAGAEDSWLRCYTANREQENWPQSADYPTVASLKALLTMHHATTTAQFARDADALLAQDCTLPWGRHVTMGQAVWHVFEHETHHRGEVYLMLGLMGTRAPDIQSLTAQTPVLRLGCAVRRARRHHPVCGIFLPSR